mmetsp:Transcript_353/g.638  ORF Transcript_353/g.638 Transcript_353/m.638 type:complete len:162 (+) Transcript_353:735-1220(+)
MRSLREEKEDPNQIFSYDDPSDGRKQRLIYNPNDLVEIRARKFYRIFKSNSFKLKRALTYGPVTVMVNTGDPFKFYSEGVIDSPECRPEVNHAVLAVGFGKYVDAQGKSEDYFILKNSWGKYWGEKGYARVSASTSVYKQGFCGLYVESYQAYIDEGPAKK